MAISVEQTRDYAMIRGFMTHPSVYDCITDDGCGPPETFAVCESPLVTYVLVRLDGTPVGVFMFSYENVAACQVHTCMTPPIWGRTHEAAKMAATWIWTNTKFVRINTQVPVFNKLAERLSKRAGMSQYGLCPRAFMKNGELWDIALYGMSKD